MVADFDLVLPGMPYPSLACPILGSTACSKSYISSVKNILYFALERCLCAP